MTTWTLLRQQLWRKRLYHETPRAESIQLSYARARSVVEKVDMTIEDIATLSPKFWAIHLDYIMTADAATAIILVIHWNLCMGTIAARLDKRPDLHGLVQQLQRFDVCGAFMLTEMGHGLDARNIETTATRNPDGSFDLHTPNWEASKVMPPTTPLGRVPCTAIVFAQLLVDGERRGVRPFIVRIHGRRAMARGVTSRLLPPKAGAGTELDHAMTTFHHVRLEPSSLLGNLDESEGGHQDFLRHIQRVTVGTLSLSMIWVPVLRLSGYLLGRYSQRRLIGQETGEGSMSIVAFSTQHTPILMALTTASVLQAYADDTWRRFRIATDDRLKSALACIYKQAATHSGRQLMDEMIDRCGWRGLFAHNRVIEMACAMRGNAIAEGDILVLCIRLASELLLGRYAVPEAADPNSLLARHETGVWKEASEILADIRARGETHRSETFNVRILPRARSLIQAIGDRMSYEAAVLSDAVSPAMLDLYETTCVLRDMSWYVENLGLSRAELQARHASAVERLLPRLNEMLEATGADVWATAPMLSAGARKEWADGLVVFVRDKYPQIHPLTQAGSPWPYRMIKSIASWTRKQSDGNWISWEGVSRWKAVQNLWSERLS
ncbi:Acyl-CoA dehydrogenase/oxidase [Ophiocordyceps camponoti-floridani]|uniref:Acyl-CoA dehydrogenase/oxidase n=1 Tax=Ophiocordyceps camponoti-floridani TaxID=2030778 RepID=A0A8H4Q8P9_9HYPO|nr:Acyl-CoA dehydrogenase/oxidase [Ophiocordyceps camponoti-floridani]